MNNSEKMSGYWQENLRLLAICLIIWFIVSYLFGILWVDTLNEFQLGGYPLGFWFAQQGSIYTFLLIIYFYTRQMNKLDIKYDVNEE